MADRLVLGIDPGLTGALAAFDPARPGAVVVHDMPVAGGMVDAAELARLVREIGPTEAVVEQVASRPGQRVASMFKFGATYGAALATVATVGLPVRLVPPTQWKKHFRLGADKEGARALAVRLWPASFLLAEERPWSPRSGPDCPLRGRSRPGDATARKRTWGMGARRSPGLADSVRSLRRSGGTPPEAGSLQVTSDNWCGPWDRTKL